MDLFNIEGGFRFPQIRLKFRGLVYNGTIPIWIMNTSNIMSSHTENFLLTPTVFLIRQYLNSNYSTILTSIKIGIKKFYFFHQMISKLDSTALTSPQKYEEDTPSIQRLFLERVNTHLQWG